MTKRRLMNLVLLLPIVSSSLGNISFTKKHEQNLEQAPSSHLEQTLKIGDSMPKPRGYCIETQRNKEGTIECRIYSDEIECYQICSGTLMKNPFILIDDENRILYLDYENKLEIPIPDGKIDEIKKLQDEEEFSLFVPDCITNR